VTFVVVFVAVLIHDVYCCIFPEVHGRYV